jgi:hypothetical protein
MLPASDAANSIQLSSTKQNILSKMTKKNIFETK